MNKHLFRAAGLAGLLALAWVAAGYLRTNPLAHPLALAMTLLMAGFYGMGVLELHRYDRTTAGLNQALQGLATAPADAAELDRWLALVPAPLRTTVRLRVAGERAALPGPALAPYLAGLLVLLGMLGTFVGMVVTLNGTGVALEQATTVQGMRDSLAAPVRGLGLAFGTSVAGVAASAMLGLMSALCRRDRLQTGQLLDSHGATTLQAFSRAQLLEQQRRLERDTALQLQQQRHDESLALQRQLQDTLQRQQAQLEQHARESARALLDGQQQFHAHAQQAYTALADSVSQALQHSLHTSAHSAAAGIQAAVQDTMAGISRETAALHTQVAAAVQQQLSGYAQRFESQSSGWLDAVNSHARQQTAALLQALGEAQAHQQAQQATRDEQHTAALRTTLASMAAQLEQAGSQMATQAQAHARSTLDELARLVHAATEAPRDAVQVMAGVVSQLRDELSSSLVRDNGLLQERVHMMDTMHTLLNAVQHTSTEQKAAIDQMVASTAAWLQQAGAQHSQRVDAETARLETVSAQLTSSAVDVASLGEALNTAVDLYSQSNTQLVGHLQKLEAALDKSSARSDDQLAYYVAQAREVIDLSLLSQKQIVDDLQRLASRGTAAAADQAAPGTAAPATATQTKPPAAPTAPTKPNRPVTA